MVTNILQGKTTQEISHTCLSEPETVIDVNGALSNC